MVFVVPFYLLIVIPTLFILYFLSMPIFSKTNMTFKRVEGGPTCVIFTPKTFHEKVAVVLRNLLP
jgi:hypothetical protein